MKKIEKLIHLLPAMITAVIVCSCDTGQKKSVPVEETADRQGIVFTSEQVRQAGMEFGYFQDAMLSHDVYAKGKLKVPNNKLATVSTAIGGIVREIFVNPGQHVRKGQALCRLVYPDIIEVQQEYWNAKFDLDLAKEQFERQQLLMDEDISSEKAFQKAERDYLSAKVNFDALEMNMQLAGFDIESLKNGNIKDHLDIRSPITGKVNEVQIHLGQYVDPDRPLFRVLDKTQMYVELMVFEKDIPFVSIGQRVTISLSNISDQVYEGHISTISSSMDETARSIPVIAVIDDIPQNAYAGMFVASTIHTGEATYKALPEGAIISDNEDENYIYYTLDEPDTATEFHFEKMEVKPLLLEEGYASVDLLDSLPENAHIVLKGGYYIRSMYIRSLE
jgi:cobalt-zinc-cadmium efflux system membrane fusion protein